MNDELRLVFWELTARCNLKCCHCRAEAQATAAEGEFSTREILSTARAIRDTADPILILTGGEPLVRKDFLEIAAACARLFTRVALATNGTLIDDDAARAIVACGIRRVSISLDGASAATHDAFRGVPGSFDRALCGYDALLGAGASLQVNVTLTWRNLGEIDDLLRLAVDRRADAFHVFVLVPVGCGASLDEGSRLRPAETEVFLQWLFSKSAEYQGRLHIKATCAPQYYRIMRPAGRPRTPAEDSAGRDAPRAASDAARHGVHALTRGCLAGSAVCFVSRTGDVQPCGYLPLPVGNVREQPFGDIWRGAPIFAALRDEARLGGKCGACGYRALCGGCRARAFAATGDFLGEDPDCAHVVK